MYVLGETSVEKESPKFPVVTISEDDTGILTIGMVFIKYWNIDHIRMVGNIGILEY